MISEIRFTLSREDGEQKLDHKNDNESLHVSTLRVGQHRVHPVHLVYVRRGRRRRLPRAHTLLAAVHAEPGLLPGRLSLSHLLCF